MRCSAFIQAERGDIGSVPYEQRPIWNGAMHVGRAWSCNSESEYEYCCIPGEL